MSLLIRSPCAVFRIYMEMFIEIGIRKESNRKVVKEIKAASLDIDQWWLVRR